jgi:hypothetical protein
MKSASRPFFIMIHYFDAHRPYRVPTEYVDLVRRPGDPDPFSLRAPDNVREGAEPAQEVTDRERLLYSGCIRYVDDAIGKLVAYLEEAGLDGKTVLVVTSDHGEAFWEHGAMAHGSNLYDEAVKVPLIIRYPSKYAQPQRIDAQVRHIDLLPTIVDLAGVTDSRRREGVSLGPLIETGLRAAAPGRMLPQDVALCECGLKKTPDTKCIRTNDLKLIIEPATALLELYDLKADPGETINLWGKGIPEADTLSRMLSAVPGSTVNGWRVAFTGQTGAEVGVDVAVAKGGRLAGVRTVSSPGALVVNVAGDSASFTIGARPMGLQIVLFDVQPKEARVDFAVRSVGSGGPTAVNIGRAGIKPMGAQFTLGPQDASGLPAALGQARVAEAPGAQIWWLPGQEMLPPGERTALSFQAKKRLRALGYVQ